MAVRRDSRSGSAIQVVAGAVVGLGCGIVMREFTDWQWWIRYPLILVAVFVAAVVVEVFSQRRTQS